MKIFAKKLFTKKIFAGMVLLMYTTFYISGVSANINYKASVDYDYGFYKVIGADTRPITDTENSSIYYPPINYTNNSLTINIGETVTWINYDQKDWPLTIISEQGLWSETNSRLKWSYQKFNYTFTEPGIYTVYIKENDKRRQTIIVNPRDMAIPTDKPIIGIVNTPEPAETPVYTPVVTQTSIIPEKTTTNTIPGFVIITTIIAILLTLYFRKKIDK